MTEEAAPPTTFGEWLKNRRRELDLTQAELSQRAGCSVPALRKIEGGERRPSKQLAGLLALSLEIPGEYQETFIRVARGELNLERLPTAASEPTRIHKPAPLPSPPPGNLPKLLTPFIGREPEQEALRRFMQDPNCRLLTIVGPGGIGKTRLAIEAACQHHDLFRDGTWFVPLAPISSPEYLVPAISDAMNFKCHGLTSPQNNLLNYLRNKQLLLILDNTEHLLGGASLFAEILENSQQVKLLVTSRERLSLLSEWVFEIQGLPVPPDDVTEGYEKYSSVELFLQCARRVCADFDPQDKERSSIVRICQIMDGMPLGIELAAAWVGVLSCKEIAREIENNIDFLAVSMRDLPERHRSLRATLDHSWNLLNSEEKAILGRLSVFQGSFRREAAEAICGASLTILASLKDKSLLRRTERGRYDLHELIQQYAALRLSEAAHESEWLKDQHAFYFARRMMEWENALKCSNQTETLYEMAHEIGNLRQAWERLVYCSILDCLGGNLRSPSLFHSTLFSLSLFYELRCRNREAISLFGHSLESLKAARDLFNTPEDRWFLDTIVGHITAYLGLHYAYVQDFPYARDLLEEAIRTLDSNLAKLEKAQAQIMLAWLHDVQGQIQEKINLLNEAAGTIKEEGDTWWYTLALTNLASAYLSIGKIEECAALTEEASRLVVPGDLRLGIPIRSSLARMSVLQKDYAGAERQLKENLDLSFQLGSKRQTAYCYLDLGREALASGQIVLAETNFQECIKLLTGFGDSHNLGIALIYSGKCLIAQGDITTARDQFLRVIQIGRILNIFYLVYWGLVHLARIELIENHPERALEMSLVLQSYSAELKEAQKDNAELRTELQTRLSQSQALAAAKWAEGNTIDSLLELV